MNNSFEALLKSTCERSLASDLERYNLIDAKDFSYVGLNSTDKNLLAHKMLILPSEYISVLFFKYCFHFSAKSTEELLEDANARGRLWYVKKLLSRTMRLEENTLIDDASMKSACKVALNKYVFCDPAATLVVPDYSNKFRHKLKSIKSAQKKSNVILLIARRVAVVALVSLMGFSTAIVANAEFREMVLDWLVETFPQFTNFGSTNEQGNNSPERYEQLKRYQLSYFPVGYKLCDSFAEGTLAYRSYQNDQGKSIAIEGRLSDGSTVALDTEGAEVKTMVFKGALGYYWEKNDTQFIVWQQDGYEFNLITELSSEESFKIAESLELP